METSKMRAIIEAILFATGREVEIKEFMSILEAKYDDVVNVLENMKLEFNKEDRGIELIRVNEAYQLCTKKEMHEYLYPVFDKRTKPTLSQAAIETLSIIAYNPKITKAEVEAIRGVNSDGVIYKLLDYNLIEEAGKIDVPGKPQSYKTTSEFLKLFGMNKLDELPELPKYKLDENQQIVIDEYIEDVNTNGTDNTDDIQNAEEKNNEAPMPSEVENLEGQEQ